MLFRSAQVEAGVVVRMAVLYELLTGAREAHGLSGRAVPAQQAPVGGVG